MNEECSLDNWFQNNNIKIKPEIQTQQQSITDDKKIPFQLNKIYNLDCREGLRMLPDNSVDIIITSPPYNINKDIRTGGTKYIEYKDSLHQDDYYRFMRSVIWESIRVARYSFVNFQILRDNKIAWLELMGDLRHNIKDIIIWHKRQAPSPIVPTALASAYEFVICFAETQLCVNKSFERAFFNNREKGQWNINVIEGNSNSVDEFNDNNMLENRAAYPQYFVRWFLDKFTAEQDLVVDPFMGTGTTGIVCKCANRNFIGFEIDKVQCDKANQHIQSIRTLNEWR